ncbi:MAG TPA: Xaa-Pro peptidase family protein [Syntrophorhabdales bacterium]|nr:Xaa-Pro peptidase family protein [Syntrophorhabdales bacterium]
MSDGNRKLEKALKLINQKGLDGLIIYSSGTCFVLKPFYFYYFTEFRPIGSNNAALVSRSGDVLLLLGPRWDAGRAARQSWIRNIQGTSDFFKDLTNVLRKFNMTGTVGVAGADQMTYPLYEGLRREAAVEPADDIIEEMAQEKTSEELEVIRKTARIADIGLQAFLRHARIGIRECELLAEVEFAMRSAGADDIFNLMGSGSHNYAMHAPTDRRLASGDAVIGEITPACEGQFVQLCRTVFLGSPAPVLVEKYDILVRALAESLKQVKAGNPAALISKGMNGVISQAGYGKYCYPPYMRARGHGFGVGSIAPGAVIDDDTEAVLKKNQVVIAHPNQYFPETGYLACGETILITEAGFERLSQTETRLYSNEG